MPDHFKDNKDSLIISSLLETDPEFLDLIERYVATLPEKIDEICQVADQECWQTLKGLVHDLKGVSGNYGFSGISELAAELESQLKSHEYGDIKGCVEQLQQLQSRIVVSKAS